MTYDPKFTQKQMYDQYGRSRKTTPKVDPKPSRGSGFSGMGADPAERFGGSPTKGLGSKPFERGSTYDVIPTPPQRDDKPDPPTSIIDTVKNKAVELFKSFGGDDPKDTEVDPSKVYRGPLFRGPINPGVIEARIRDAVDYSKAPPLFYSGIPSDANMRYDVVPPITANKDRVKNAVNAFLKQRGIGGKEYTIKRGDTLSEIAQREGVAIDDLAKVNKIENINRILAGETLIIPPPQEMERAKDIVDSVDPDAQFYQSGVPLDQRIFEPELGYDEIPLPSEATVDKKIRGLGARPEVAVTELAPAGVTTDDDMGLPSTRSETETIMALEPMFEFIQEGEGDYNSSNRGTIGKKIIGSTNNTTRDGKSLTEMTIGEIQTKQAITDPNNTERLFAVGRFQTIPTTLAMAVDALNLSDDTVFNEDTQNKIGKYLITQKRERVGRYLEGSSTVSQDRAMLELAKEFASFPVPYDMTVRRNGKDVKLKKGDSYYGSGNKAQHTVDEVKDELDKLRGNI